MPSPNWETETSATGSSSSQSIATPAGTQNDDLLLLHINYEGGSAITVTNGNFTTLRTDFESEDVGQRIAYRVHDGGALGSFSFSEEVKWAFTIGRISGPDTTTPIHVDAGANGTEFDPDPPPVTTTITDTLIVVLVGNKTTTLYTPPSGYTEEYDNPNTTDGVPSNEGSHKDLPTATTENPGVADAVDEDSWVAATVAIAPSGGAPATVIKDPIGGGVVPFAR